MTASAILAPIMTQSMTCLLCVFTGGLQHDGGGGEQSSPSASAGSSKFLNSCLQVLGWDSNAVHKPLLDTGKVLLLVGVCPCLLSAWVDSNIVFVGTVRAI